MKAIHAELAESIARSRRTGIRQCAVAWDDELQGEDDAYQVQDQVAASLGWFKPGEVQFWKSGGSSRFDGLSHARLPPHSVRPGGMDISDLRLHKPYMAGEIVLRLRQHVTPERAAHLTQSAAESLIDSMTVGIEISDSRWQEHWEAPVLLRLADALSHGALILDEWQPYFPRDWSKQGCEVDAGTSPVVFTGAYSLKDPAWLLPAWLKHATRNGETVPAGSAVTTGSWSGGIACRPGTLIRAAFAGIGKVDVEL